MLLDACVAKYEAACSARRTRAAKFGTHYEPPDIKHSMPWSLVKRISSHAQVNMDVQSDDESSLCAAHVMVL